MKYTKDAQIGIFNFFDFLKRKVFKVMVWSCSAAAAGEDTGELVAGKTGP